MGTKKSEKHVISLQVLKRTRRKPQAGDIFTFRLMQLPDRYFYGRVVATDTRIGGITEIGLVLVYLYRRFSYEKATIPTLDVSDLLLPPIGTNNVPWTSGYFEVIQSGENKQKDLLAQHCFYSPFRNKYFDEYGNVLSSPIEPVGIYGLAGIGAIDLDICKALRITAKNA